MLEFRDISKGNTTAIQGRTLADFYDIKVLFQFQWDTLPITRKKVLPHSLTLQSCCSVHLPNKQITNGNSASKIVTSQYITDYVANNMDVQDTVV